MLQNSIVLYLIVFFPLYLLLTTQYFINFNTERSGGKTNFAGSVILSDKSDFCENCGLLFSPVSISSGEHEHGVSHFKIICSLVL